MCSKLLKSTFLTIFLMPILVISICRINNNICFAIQNDTLPDELVGSLGVAENMADNTIYLKELAEMAINVLISSRGVVAKNQDLINRDPITGNYAFKGFVPAVVGSQVANDFSLMTGHRLKQTSLKVRNPSNAADEWEKKVLKLFESSKHYEEDGFGEILKENGKDVYKYMKPIYVEIACLQCHGKKGEILPSISQFLESKYPFDQAFGYELGDLRGGISIVISLDKLSKKIQQNTQKNTKE